MFTVHRVTDLSDHQLHSAQKTFNAMVAGADRDKARGARCMAPSLPDPSEQLFQREGLQTELEPGPSENAEHVESNFFTQLLEKVLEDIEGNTRKRTNLRTPHLKSAVVVSVPVCAFQALEIVTRHPGILAAGPDVKDNMLQAATVAWVRSSEMLCNVASLRLLRRMWLRMPSTQRGAMLLPCVEYVWVRGTYA